MVEINITKELIESILRSTINKENKEELTNQEEEEGDLPSNPAAKYSFINLKTANYKFSKRR